MQIFIPTLGPKSANEPPPKKSDSCRKFRASSRALKFPSSSVVTVRSSPVPVFFTLTAAPGGGAPEVSVRVPRIVPRKVCALPLMASALGKKIEVSTKLRVRARLRIHAIMKVSSGCLWFTSALPENCGLPSKKYRHKALQVGLHCPRASECVKQGQDKFSKYGQKFTLAPAIRAKFAV